MVKHIIAFTIAYEKSRATFMALSKHMDISQWRAKVQEAQQKEAEAFRELAASQEVSAGTLKELKFSWEK